MLQFLPDTEEKLAQSFIEKFDETLITPRSGIP